MKRIGTLSVILSSATLIGLTVAGVAHAYPAEPGIDQGAYCDWAGSTVPDGSPGTLYAWRGQNAPGVAMKNAGTGTYTFIVIGGNQITITDNQVGANGDVLRGFFYACNTPTPTP